MHPRHNLVLQSILVVLGTTGLGATPLVAQGWDAILAVNPVPSPYLSDWEANPNYGTLTVFNGSGQSQSVRLVFNVVDMRGRLLASGRSDPQLVPADAPAIFDDPFEIAGSTRHDTEVEAQMRRTGRLPEGDYRACVAVVDLGGFQLAEACEVFSVVYPDPPLLVAPFDGEVVTTQDFFLQWTPSQVPLGFDLRYVLEIAEVRQSQLPAEALRSNILHFHDPDVAGTQLLYPLAAQPLEPGRRYAWRVRALDINGYPVAANDGSSEIWTFRYSTGAEQVALVELTPSAATVSQGRDTVRLDVTAYDAYDLAIDDAQVQWRTLDTTVARVDSGGLVTWVGAGATHILATVDGVTDSAQVTAAPVGLSVRFAQYDAASEQPTLLELVQSGSYDDVVPRLMAMLETGEFVIPIPRLPGLEGAAGDAGGGEDGGGDAGRSHGPSADAGDAAATTGHPGRTRNTCSEIVIPGVSATKDDARKIFVVQFGGLTEQTCLPVPEDAEEGAQAPADTSFHRSTIFAISWEHPGLPRVFLVAKGIGQLPLPLAGTEVRLRYLALALLRPVTLEAAILPEQYAGFFGTESFDAGFGLTLYSKRRCVDSDQPLSAMEGVCWLLSTINEKEPDITVHAFAGITASETSGGIGGPGTSLALGFSISATSPVGRLYWDIGEFSFDSIQVGLMFAVQDSMVEGGGVDNTHNWSVGVAGTFTVWMQGANDNVWQVDGSVGVEIDPSDGLGSLLKPKLVLSAQVAQVWKIWVIRLGNPQLVFTTPIGPRSEREATELAISGTWGFGPPEGIGIEEGGGDVVGDVGGGATGGVEGFEEFGRAQVVFSWKRPPTQATQRQGREVRDSATAAVTRHLHLVRAARERERYASQDRGLARESGDQDRIRAAETAYTEAKQALDAAEATLARLRAERETARAALQPPKCWRTLRERCINWSARLSVGNGAFSDLIAMLFRGPGG